MVRRLKLSTLVCALSFLCNIGVSAGTDSIKAWNQTPSKVVGPRLQELQTVVMLNLLNHVPLGHRDLSACDSQQGCNDLQEPGLPDLLHSVPALWQWMHSHCLNNLLATNTILRGQVHDFVTKVKLKSSKEITWVVCGKFPCLLSLEIMSYEKDDRLERHTAAELFDGRLPCLNSLKFWSTKLDAPALLELARAGRFKLVSLSCFYSVQDTAAFKALTHSNFQSLQMFSYCLQDPEHQAIESLFKADWPNLRKLTLGMAYLGNQGSREKILEDLEADSMATNKWVDLQEVNMSHFRCSAAGLRLMFAGQQWLNLCTLSLLELADVTMSEIVHMVTAAILPRLCSLQIVGQKQDLCADDVRRLAAGQWPLLETLRADVPFEYVHYLRHASWPKLKSLQVCRYSGFVVQNSVWVT